MASIFRVDWVWVDNTKYAIDDATLWPLEADIKWIHVIPDDYDYYHDHIVPPPADGKYKTIHCFTKKKYLLKWLIKMKLLKPYLAAQKLRKEFTDLMTAPGNTSLKPVLTDIQNNLTLTSTKLLDATAKTYGIPYTDPNFIKKVAAKSILFQKKLKCTDIYTEPLFVIPDNNYPEQNHAYLHDVVENNLADLQRPIGQNWAGCISSVHTEAWGVILAEGVDFGPRELCLWGPNDYPDLGEFDFDNNAQSLVELEI